MKELGAQSCKLGSLFKYNPGRAVEYLMTVSTYARFYCSLHMPSDYV